MKKSGLADSPFFAPTKARAEPVTPPPANLPVEKVEPVKLKNQKQRKLSNQSTVIPRHHATMTPRYHGIMTPSLNW